MQTVSGSDIIYFIHINYLEVPIHKQQRMGTEGFPWHWTSIRLFRYGGRENHPLNTLYPLKAYNLFVATTNIIINMTGSEKE